MTTSNETTRPSLVPPPGGPPGEPLRLELARVPGQDRLDGAWWPRSRDLSVELAQLVADFPPGHGRIVRAVCSSPDWDAPLRGVPGTTDGPEVGTLPGEESHLVLLTFSDATVLRLLVVPPGLTPDQGEEALLAAATAGNAHSAADLLAEVTNSPDLDVRDRWTYPGEAWAGASSVPPAPGRGQVPGV